MVPADDEGLKGQGDNTCCLESSRMSLMEIVLKNKNKILQLETRQLNFSLSLQTDKYVKGNMYFFLHTAGAVEKCID